MTNYSNVSLADIEDAIGFRYDTTAEKVLLDHGEFGCHVMNSPAGKPLNGVFICILVMLGGVVVVGRHVDAAGGEDGRKLAYVDAIQQLWTLIGGARKDAVNERYGFGCNRRGRRDGPSGVDDALAFKPREGPPADGAVFGSGRGNRLAADRNHRRPAGLL
jgi:hypothetical protein